MKALPETPPRSLPCDERSTAGLKGTSGTTSVVNARRFLLHQSAPSPTSHKPLSDTGTPALPLLPPETLPFILQLSNFRKQPCKHEQHSQQTRVRRSTMAALCMSIDTNPVGPTVGVSIDAGAADKKVVPLKCFLPLTCTAAQRTAPPCSSSRKGSTLTTAGGTPR